MAASAREIPIYTVWRFDNDETESDGRPYGAIDVGSAAELYADYCHRHRDGWEWTWPVVFNVKDPDGETWVVEVARETVPEFNAAKPLPAAMPRMCHVLQSGNRGLCEDPRLGSHWPDSQKFFTVAELQRGGVPISDISCERCRQRAPGLLEGLRSIGALREERKRGA